MPTRNVNLTPELDRAVSERVDSGRYENASEVMRAALRALEHQERQDAIRLQQLQKDLEEGDASKDFEGDPFEAAYQQLKWRPSSKAKGAGRKRSKARG